MNHIVLKAVKQTVLHVKVLNQYFKLTDQHSFKNKTQNISELV